MKVEVLSNCFSGVNITIGEARDDIHEVPQAVRFIRYGDQINPERL